MEVSFRGNPSGWKETPAVVFCLPPLMTRNTQLDAHMKTSAKTVHLMFNNEKFRTREQGDLQGKVALLCATNLNVPGVRALMGRKLGNHQMEKMRLQIDVVPVGVDWLRLDPTQCRRQINDHRTQNIADSTYHHTAGALTNIIILKKTLNLVSTISFSRLTTNTF